MAPSELCPARVTRSRQAGAVRGRRVPRYASTMSRALPEMEELLRILDAAGTRIEARVACEVEDRDGRWPVVVATLGNPSPEVPAVGFFGGVHGLERVGTQVVLSFLGSVVSRLHWDEALHEQLRSMRMVFMPLVNPAGMRHRTRSNANGVDLMRNAPVESAERVAFLVGGQRVSARLPWYRGAAAGPMEAESQALCDVVRAEMLGRPFSVAIDCHSGFGMRDRIWFPHARTRAPFAHLPEVHALMALFDALYPRHAYVFEPQSRQYLTHGDLWDYLAAESEARPGIFLPLTLEMGSWRWIRKSPRQALTRLGIFNPIPADRLERVRRNHLLWLGFLCRAANDSALWLPAGAERERHRREALAAWFGRAA